MSEESLIGRWAVCSIGRLGKIEDRKELPWGLSWVGTGIDGQEWASRNPRVLCDSDAVVLAEKLEKAWQYDDLAR